MRRNIDEYLKRRNLTLSQQRAPSQPSTHEVGHELVPVGVVSQEPDLLAGLTPGGKAFFEVQSVSTRTVEDLVSNTVNSPVHNVNNSDWHATASDLLKEKITHAANNSHALVNGTLSVGWVQVAPLLLGATTFSWFAARFARAANAVATLSPGTTLDLTSQVVTQAVSQAAHASVFPLYGVVDFFSGLATYTTDHFLPAVVVYQIARTGGNLLTNATTGMTSPRARGVGALVGAASLGGSALMVFLRGGGPTNGLPVGGVNRTHLQRKGCGLCAT